MAVTWASQIVLGMGFPAGYIKAILVCGNKEPNKLNKLSTIYFVCQASIQFYIIYYYEFTFTYNSYYDKGLQQLQIFPTTLLFSSRLELVLLNIYFTQ